MELISISDINQFLEVKNDWNNLLQISDSDNLFLRHEWLSSWWQSYGKDRELKVLLLKKDGVLIGGVPLMYTQGKVRGLPVRKIAFMGDSTWTSCDFVTAGHRIDVLEKVIDYLVRVRWDLIDLQNIPVDSENTVSIPEIYSKRGFQYLSMESSVSPYVKIDMHWEDFLKKRPIRFRKSMRNKLNKIDKSGDVKIHKYCTPEEIKYALPEAFKISQNGWKYNEKNAMSSTDEDKSFYSRLSIEMSNLGWLAIWLLEFNGTPVAFEYQITFKKRVHALVADYDLAYKNLSPGSVLDYHIMKNFTNSENLEYDLGSGNSFYKANWTDKVKKHRRIYIYKNTLYGKMLKSVEGKIIPSLKRFRNKLDKIHVC